MRSTFQWIERLEAKIERSCVWWPDAELRGFLVANDGVWSGD